MKEQRPLISGFCNPSNPPKIHGSCRLDGCACEHHTAAEPLTWTGDNA